MGLSRKYVRQVADEVESVSGKTKADRVYDVGSNIVSCEESMRLQIGRLQRALEYAAKTLDTDTLGYWDDLSEASDLMVLKVRRETLLDEWTNGLDQTIPKESNE